MDTTHQELDTAIKDFSQECVDALESIQSSGLLENIRDTYNHIQPDKAAQRKRSRDDVRAKRKELFRTRGKAR